MAPTDFDTPEHRRFGTRSHRIGAVVICGGQSRRMGTEKVWLEWQGRPMLSHLVDRLLAWPAEGSVVAGMDQHLPPLNPKAIILRDSLAQQGPAAAMVQGLQSMAHCEAVWVTSCDSPEPQTALLERLVALLCDSKNPTEHDAIVPCDDARLYPLNSLYRPAVIDRLRRLVLAGEKRLQRVIQELNIARVSTESLRAVDPELRTFWNLNDPETLRLCRGRMTHHDRDE